MRLRGVAIGTTAAALGRLGLTVVDDHAAAVGDVTIEAVPDRDGDGLLGLDLGGAPADGPLPLVDVAPVAEHAHPLGATAVDHVVVLAGDVEAAIAGLGAEPRRIDERDGRRYGFVVAETALLEFVGPAEPDDRPARLWGIALTVDDVDAAAALLGAAAGAPKDAVQPGRRIVTVRHERLGFPVPTVLLSPR